MLAFPNARVRSAPLLDEASRKTQIQAWNQTGSAYPWEKGLHELIEDQARAFPQRTALVCENTTLSYAELMQWTGRIAATLLEKGLRRETPVGVYMNREALLPATLIGVLRAGGCYVPVDPALPQARVKHILASVPLVLSHGDLAARLQGTTHATVIDLERDLLEPGPSEAVPYEPGRLAYIIFTSGSTGLPKGVEVTHQSLVNFLYAMGEKPGIQTEDSLLAATTVSFDIAGLELFLPLLHGARLVLTTKDDALDGGRMIDKIVEHGVTMLQATPSGWRAMLATGRTLPSRLRILCGGEALSGELAQRLCQSGNQVWNLYGPTETTIWSTVRSISAVDNQGTAAIGRPIANTQIYILNDWLEPVPVGVVGNLYIGGLGLARCYHRRPDLTARAFIPDPFGGTLGARLYHTGDRARYSTEGTIHYRGRADQQVKIRGFRIEPGEIEVLLCQRADIDSALVTVYETPAGSQHLVAYVIRTGAIPGETSVWVSEDHLFSRELARDLVQKLPDYMMPTSYVFVSSFPLGPSGKINRRALPKPGPSSPRERVAPRNPLEQTIATVWCRVLDLGEVGVFENFFELGGDSILSISIATALAGQGLTIEVKDLFQHQNIAALAGVVGQTMPPEAAQNPEGGPKLAEPEGDPVTPVQNQGDTRDHYPLSPIQEGMLFHHLYEAGTGIYSVQISRLLRGDLDLARFKGAWEKVIERHDLLRTGFLGWSELDRPQQAVYPAGELPLQEHDWRDMSEEEQSSALTAFLKRDLETEFELSRPPLMRFHLIRLNRRSRRFVWNFHHILMDGWSLAVVLQEFLSLYSDPTCATSLREPVPYRTYIDWLGHHNNTGVESFWRRYLQGFYKPTPLPEDQLCRGGKPQFGERRLSLSTHLTQQLKSLARNAHTTLNILFQTAWAVIVGRCVGEDDLVFGVVDSGRPPALPGVERIVGLLVNTLPVRARLNGRCTLHRQLALFHEDQVKRAQFAFTPPVQVQGFSEVPRGVPLFEVLLAFENYPVGGGDEELAADLLLGDGMPTSSDLTNYPLTLFAAPGPQLSLRLSYNLGRLADASATRLLLYMETVFTHMAAAPDLALDQIQIMPGALRDRFLVELNKTDEPVTAKSIQELVAQRVRQTPDQDAVLFDRRRLSYLQLERCANVLAARLKAFGVAAEIPVAICLPRRPHLLVGLYAILKANGMYVPLDPDYPAIRRDLILQDTAAPLVICDRETARLLPDHLEKLFFEEGDLDAAQAETETLAFEPTTPQQGAYLIYTSGSTGTPKGVVISHGNGVAFLEWARGFFPEHDGVLAATSVGFDLSVFELFGTLCRGGTIVLCENVLHLPDLPARDRVTMLNTVPSSLAALLAQGALPEGITTVNLAGEPFSAELVGQLFAQSRVKRLFNFYGPSEDTTYSTQAAVLPKEPPAIGKPIANTAVYVLDAGMEVVPHGAPGNLYLAGSQLSRGYLNRAGLTAERFIPNPFSEKAGSRLYLTGDRVCYGPDDRLMFLGRSDHQVKIRGFRIEPGEIESYLANHEAVEKCLVNARDDKRGEPRLTAYIVPKQDARNTGDEEASSAQLALWRKVWEDTYEDSWRDDDATVDLVGWKDSYTGEPIAKEDMREWFDHTVKRILSYQPKRILEIGCGTGLLLFRLVPLCESYFGTDISGSVLSGVRRQLTGMDVGSRVKLAQRAADDFADFEPGQFDMIIINSVAQYFPGMDYFVHVLEQALGILAPGGTLFLGDLRNGNLLSHFHASLQVFQSGDDVNLDQLKQRIHEHITRESELLIAPEFFAAFQKHTGVISHVALQLKRGRALNEMTRFRYDAVLSLEPKAESPEGLWLDWREEGLSPERLPELLKRHPALTLKRVPNARLADEQLWLGLLASEDGNTTLGVLRARGGDLERGMEPEFFYELAASLGIEVLVTWAEPETGGDFNVYFHPAGTRPFRARPDGTEEPRPDSHFRAFANNPLHGKLTRDLVPQLRTHLQERLPKHMVPSAFVILDSMPLTGNGKIDRAALPVPEFVLEAGAKTFVEARSNPEKEISAVWCEVLGLEKVSIGANFFDLGGHSLLLAQVHGKLKDRIDRDIPLMDLFRFPNIKALAAHLVKEAPAEQAGPIGRPETRVDEIAVIGFSGRFPGADTVADFWANLLAGVTSGRRLDDRELLDAGVDPELIDHPNYVRINASLDHVDYFDAAFFDYSPAEAQVMDPQHRLFLEETYHALEHAGYDPHRFPGEIGIYAGCGLSAYLFTYPQIADMVGGFEAMIANDKDYLPSRAAYKLNLRGPAVNVQSACSTSLVAVHLACLGLQNGDCTIALAGGANVGLREKTGYLYEEGSLYAPDGHCRAFDARAEGTFFGDGLALVVLKPLAQARADLDHIHFVLKGSAVNNDGAERIGFTAPGLKGQETVIARALASAGVSAKSIGYVETHGTGTKLGDPIEINALTAAYRRYTPDKAYCAVGSLKTNVGHLGFAAGVAGLIKAGLCLEHKRIPASLHFEKANPNCNLETSPFFVNTTLRPWLRSEPDTPLRAGVSSFGLGGANAHAILEEPPQPVETGPGRAYKLLVFSAKTHTAVDNIAAEFGNWLEQNPGANLADVAYTLQIGRGCFAHRRTLVCRDHAHGIAALDGNHPGSGFRDSQGVSPSVVFMFPGGGTQYPNMGRELYEHEPVYRKYIDQCSDLLTPTLGFDLRTLLYPEPGREGDAAERLRHNILNLVSIFSTSYALARLLLSWGIHPKVMIGHSLGEYVAACISGVFTLPDALALVAYRGRLFERLARGGMIGLTMSEAELAPLLDEELNLAVVNTPTDLVVSGPTEALDRFQTVLEGRGCHYRRLHIDVAAHSALLEPALEAFARCVSGFERAAPRIPFVSNLSGALIRDDQATDPADWADHLRQTVRFSDGLSYLCRDPEAILLEVGPGRTLSGFARVHPDKQENQPVCSSLRHPKEEISDTAFLLTSLGRLWTAGITVDWAQFHTREPRARLALPTYPFDHRPFWVSGEKQHAAPGFPPPRLSDPSRWFYTNNWKRTPYPGSREVDHLLLCTTAQTENLVPILQARTQKLSLVQPPAPRHDGNSLEIPVALFRETRPDLIVYAWSLHTEKAPRHMALLTQIAEMMDKTNQPTTVVVLTRGIQDLAWDPAPKSPEQKALAGFCAGLSRRYPKLLFRTIDIDETPGLVAHPDRLVEELFAADQTPLITLRRGGRWVPDYDPIHLHQDQPTLVPDGVYVMSGTWDKIGFQLARYLFQSCRARFLFVGVDADARNRAYLAELEQMGAQCFQLTTHSSDASALKESLKAATAKWGAVNGLYHFLGFRGWPEGRWETEALRRIREIQILDELVCPTHFFGLCLPSSRGETANPSFMAVRSFVDGFVSRRVERGAHAIIWDSLPRRERVQSRGDAFQHHHEELLNEDIWTIFARVLSCRLPQVFVSTRDLEALRTYEQAQTLSEQKQAEPSAPILDEVEAGITEIWCSCLGLKDIGLDDNFFELGGHSLLATRVISRVRRQFKVDIPIAEMFRHPTVAGLVAVVKRETAEPVQLMADRPEEGGEPALSFAQERQWFLYKLGEGQATYNVPFAFRLKGELDVAVLARSIGEIVRRHHILRTLYVEEAGVPKSLVLPARTPSLPVAEPDPDRPRSEAIGDWVAAEATAPFDLSCQLPLRVALLKLEEQLYIFTVTMHHIASDGWSMGIFMRELGALYRAFHADEPSPLPELALQYSGFATLQRQRLRGEYLERLLDYWQQRLAGAPPLLALPLDRPRPAVQDYAGNRVYFEIGASATESLKALGKKAGTSLFMSLHALFATLLSRLCNQEDLLMGTVVANRNRLEIEDLIGFFVNTLVLRADCSGNPTWLDLLDHIRQIDLEAFDHQDAPFEQVVTRTQPTRILNQSPLFQVLFVLQNVPYEEMDIAGISLVPTRVRQTTAIFDLTLMMGETDHGMFGSFEYNTGLFDESTIHRLIGYFQTLLAAVLTNPEQRLQDLPLLGGQERVRMLQTWNETASPPVGGVIQRFEGLAATSPEARALVVEEQTLTYGELNGRATRLAGALREKGLGPDVLLPVCMDRSADLVVGLIAIWKCGAGYVPIDPELPLERIEMMRADTGSPRVLTEPRLAALFASGIELLFPTMEPLSPLAGQEVRRAPLPTALAYRIYTSGSTGKPKGVDISHGALNSYLAGIGATVGMSRTDVVLAAATIAFDISILDLFLSLSSGALVVMATRPQVLDPMILKALILNHKVTTLQMTPSGLANLDEGTPLKGCKLLATGEGLSPRLAAELLARGAGLWNLYGPTEATVQATAREIQQPFSGAFPDRFEAIGKPLPYRTCYIVDPSLNPVPTGVVGELCLGGRGLARGYAGQPGTTAQSFLPDPFAGSPGRRLYRTGDLARFQADGTIEVLGRTDDQIKVRGYRIEPGEIEAALLDLPHISRAVVTARAINDDGDKRLIAYLCAEPGVSAQARATNYRDRLKGQLPHYMVPEFWVWLDALPTSASGKLKRADLPLPNHKPEGPRPAHTAPSDETEYKIAAIWQEILHLERVGTDDNFFDIGGNSLLLVRVRARLSADFNLDLPIARLFENTTVAAQAKLVADKTTPGIDRNEMSNREQMKRARRRRRKP